MTNLLKKLPHSSITSIWSEVGSQVGNFAKYILSTNSGSRTQWSFTSNSGTVDCTCMALPTLFFNNETWDTGCNVTPGRSLAYKLLILSFQSP